MIIIGNVIVLQKIIILIDNDFIIADEIIIENMKGNINDCENKKIKWI